MSKETFVFGDVEVQKTGRTASSVSRGLPGGKQLIVVEVTPVKIWDGAWKKWVNPNVLMVIEGVDTLSTPST